MKLSGVGTMSCGRLHAKFRKFKQKAHDPFFCAVPKSSRGAGVTIYPRDRNRRACHAYETTNIPTARLEAGSQQAAGGARSLLRHASLEANTGRSARARRLSMYWKRLQHAWPRCRWSFGRRSRRRASRRWCRSSFKSAHALPDLRQPPARPQGEGGLKVHGLWGATGRWARAHFRKIRKFFFARAGGRGEEGEG
jgi:hypothetical protein